MTFIGVRAADGRAALDLRATDFSPRPIRVDATGAQIALVTTRALLLAGDEVDLEIEVGPGAWLDVLETAGTVAYDAAGIGSTWTVRATVADGGRLTWRGEPFVVADGANVLRRSSFRLGDGATLCTREILVLGRTGEDGGALRVRTEIHRGQDPVLIEELDLSGDPASEQPHRQRRRPGLLGGHRVLDTVTVAGPIPDTAPELAVGSYFEFTEGGATCRHLGAEVHTSPLAGVYRRWAGSLS